jgi:hypothetical protein
MVVRGLISTLAEPVDAKEQADIVASAKSVTARFCNQKAKPL